MMNINILVAEKGGPGPLGPITGSATAYVCDQKSSFVSYQS